ncbi:hypothetical protein LINGRAHAP2_LOCUS4750 [Linum grandiflorum]
MGLPQVHPSQVHLLLNPNWTVFCLNRCLIPNRLAGVTLLTPATNYWWTGFPSNLSDEALHKQAVSDYLSLSVAHCAPWLTHWWNTQKWFPGFGAISKSSHILARQDKEIVAKFVAKGTNNLEISPLPDSSSPCNGFSLVCFISIQIVVTGTHTTARRIRVDPWGHEHRIWHLGVRSNGCREPLCEE